MPNARFTNAEHTSGVFVRPNGQEVHGPLPPLAGDIRHEYAAWVAEGNSPLAYEPPPPPPMVVSAAQAKLALYNAGLYDTVVQAVSQIGYEPIKIYFESAPTWSSDHPYVQGLAAELELTDEQVVALFEAARLL